MHVVTNRRRGRHREYVTHLLRRSYREDGKVKNETLANLSHLPPEAIELVRGALRGESYLAAGEAFEIERSLPAGHVMAALSMARRLDLARLLDRSPSRERDLVMAMICERVIAPASKLATVRSLSQSVLAEELSVTDADEDDLYAALDWLLDRQERIEDRLARRHLRDGEQVLYDVSSSYFEGVRVRWRNSAIRVMVSAAHHRSSTACCVTNQAAQSRSRFSVGRCTTTRRCPHRSRSSSSVFICRAWSWSLTAGWSRRPTCRRSRTPRVLGGSQR